MQDTSTTITPRRGSADRRHANSLTLNPDHVCVAVRASTDEQTNSLEVQQDETRRFAEKNNLTIHDYYVDRGTSATKTKFLNRKSVKRMIKDMKREGIPNILILRIDRAFRSVPDMVNTLVELDNEGIGFISISPQIDSRTPSGRIQMQLLGMIAELETTFRQQRQLETFELMRGKNQARSNNASYGWQLVPSMRKSKLGNTAKDVVPHKQEQRRLCVIMRWRNSGMTWQAIADRLNAKGIPTKKGGKSITIKGGKTKTASGKWFPATVKSVYEHAHQPTT